jgi:hypothetical protein
MGHLLASRCGKAAVYHIPARQARPRADRPRAGRRRAATATPKLADPEPKRAVREQSAPFARDKASRAQLIQDLIADGLSSVAGARTEVSHRGELRYEIHLQLAFISFGANLQRFHHARLSHLAGDTQIGLMGFHQKPLRDGPKCSHIHGRLGVSDGVRGE